MLKTENRLRIGIVAPPWFAVPPLGYGGIERVVSYLANGLVGRGHDVTLFAAGGSRTPAKLVSLFEAPPSKLIGDVGIEIANSSQAYLRHREFDVIHDHSNGGLGCATLCPTPVAHTIHGPITEGAAAMFSQLAPPLQLIAISENQRLGLPIGVPAEVIHNALELESAPYGGVPGDYLLFVGRISPEKGVLDAMEIARRSNKPLLMCVKINEQSERDYFDQVVRPRLKGLDVEVRESPPEDEKQEAYRNALATLFPIQWPEPFGLVMIESMATGTPVIAYRRGSAPEVIDDGRTGFICDSLGDAVEAVSKVHTLDRRVSRKHVADHFSAEVAVDRHVALYRRILERPACETALGGVHGARFAS